MGCEYHVQTCNSVPLMISACEMPPTNNEPSMSMVLWSLVAWDKMHVLG